MGINGIIYIIMSLNIGSNVNIKYKTCNIVL